MFIEEEIKSVIDGSFSNSYHSYSQVYSQNKG